MNKSVSAILSTEGTLTVVVNNKPYSFNKDAKFYDAALAAVRSQNYDEVEKVVDMEKNLRELSNGKVTLTNGIISFNGIEIHNALTERIYTLIKLSFPFEPLLLFLENVLKNPDKTAVDDLYIFLEKCNLPLTEDGCFLAWKYVRGDFKDCHSGRFDNSPGKTVSMPRENVTKDRNVTCSYGLHVCSHSYLPQTASSDSQRIVIVKVNPKDVVSVPVDYNNSKMRVCEYVVIDEVKDTTIPNQEFDTNPIYGTYDGDEYYSGENNDYDEDEEEEEEDESETSEDTESTPELKEAYGVKPSGQRFWSVRNTSGRFTKKA